ncbi:MAG: phosphoribosylpyrophosphate synthetase [Bacteroidia bacterium]
MKTYDTLSEAVNDLQLRGFNKNFSISENCIECDAMQLNPDEFEISEVHRFEADTDPGASTILYAIESKDGIKGLLVNAYGAYSDGATDDLIEKLKIKH